MPGSRRLRTRVMTRRSQHNPRTLYITSRNSLTLAHLENDSFGGVPTSQELLCPRGLSSFRLSSAVTYSLTQAIYHSFSTITFSSVTEELLSVILKYVGVEDFYGDIDRLAACKRCYRISSLMIMKGVIVIERSKLLPPNTLDLLRGWLYTNDFKFAFCNRLPRSKSLFYKKSVLFDVELIRNLLHVC
ncbi:hypothetical protein EV356DRAFT_298088 [Viridothelium virens]|uniref:Uncharacterized protein n=1 Tax=Viridothelium virens TaxID=1048519 RepID=A0A6A6GZJ6_VIRVR|nr:hypothetical protein EV356DRAFT_298088 [Viridothelium virens]